MLIREEQASDYGSLREIVEAAFARRDEANLVDRLRRDGDAVISLVAVEGHKPVGHVMFSRMAAPFRALGLAPLAVLPERQRNGIGGALVREGIERARSQGWKGIFVVGDPGYYSRFGFDPGLTAGFVSPYAGPYLMALALGSALPTTTGRICHAPAFAAE